MPELSKMFTFFIRFVTSQSDPGRLWSGRDTGRKCPRSGPLLPGHSGEQREQQAVRTHYSLSLQTRPRYTGGYYDNFYNQHGHGHQHGHHHFVDRMDQARSFDILGLIGNALNMYQDTNQKQGEEYFAYQWGLPTWLIWNLMLSLWLIFWYVTICYRYLEEECTI